MKKFAIQTGDNVGNAAPCRQAKTSVCLNYIRV